MVGNTNAIGTKASSLTVTSSGAFSTTNIYAYKDGGLVTIGGYFSNTSNIAGSNIATVSGINVARNNSSTPVQCDDNSVKWVTFVNSGGNLVLSTAHTLTANNVVRFLATLPTT